MSEWGDQPDEGLRADANIVIRRENKQREGLIKERDALKDELARVEFSAKTQKIITATIAEIKGKIHGATFAKKRYVMDKLDVQLVLRHDDAGRWLDGTCGLGDFTISAASSARH